MRWQRRAPKENDSLEVSVGGKAVSVPWIPINDNKVIVTGKWIRTASILDEEYLEGEVVEDPEVCIAKIREKRLRADIFTFSQKLPATTPKYRYPIEWDNAAAIPTTSYSEWWEKRLPRKTKQEIGRAARLGVAVNVLELTDEFIRDIVKLYKDIPIKQGIAFKHYDKDFDTIKTEVSTFSGRSEFIAAYYGMELIGFMKLVYMGTFASMLHIISNDRHYDKRPTNALIAKAVKICEEKGMTHLLYGKFIYGNKTGNSLTEFKRRNGFGKIDVPKYYVPLTLKGRIAMKLNVHRGLMYMLPASVIAVLVKLRSAIYRDLLLPFKAPKTAQDVTGDRGLS